MFNELVSNIRRWLNKSAVHKSVGREKAKAKHNTKMLSATERAALYETVSLLNGNGIIPFEAIELKHGLLNSRKNPPKKMVDAMSIILKRIHSGQSFSSSLLYIVPDTERNLIIASEQGDSLDIGSKQAAELARSFDSVRKGLIKALLYPAGIFIGVIAVFAFFGLAMFPVFSQITPIEQWSEPMQRIYRISTTMEYWVPILILMIVSSFLVVKKSLSTWVGKLRFTFDYLPPYSIYRQYTSGIFLITLSGLMQSGVDIKKSLDLIANQTTSIWLRLYVKKILGMIRSGKRPGIALGQKMFSDNIIDEIVIYDRASPDDFSRILGEIGKRAVAEGDLAIKKLIGRINFFGMAVGGGLVGYVFMSLFELINNIQPV